MRRVRTTIRLQQEWWLAGILGVVFVMNVVDAVMTIAWISVGSASEANPIMEKLLNWGTIPFFIGKMAIVVGGSLVLWKYRKRPMAVVGIFLLFLVYYFLILYHLNMFGTILGAGGITIPTKS